MGEGGYVSTHNYMVVKYLYEQVSRTKFFWLTISIPAAFRLIVLNDDFDTLEAGFSQRFV